MPHENPARDTATVSSPSIRWTEVDRCPACDNGKRRRLAGSASSFENRLGDAVVVHPAYHLWICECCGLVYKSNAIDAKSLDRYYEDLDYSAFDVDDHFPTDRVIHQLLSKLPSKARVLDYGCSTARILRQHAHRLDCHGVEGNGKAADIANARGVKTTKALVPEQLFDFILLSDVYEHLSSPVDVVRQLVSLLEPGGKLAIVTGNAEAIQGDRVAEHWYFRILGHLHMAGSRHFGWLADALALELVSATPCSHYRLSAYARLRQTMQGLAYRLNRSTQPGPMGRLLRSIPPFSTAKTWLNEPPVTFRKDHLVVVFRKPL